jgi:tetratricopeptide (TPR) repeat protein
MLAIESSPKAWLNQVYLDLGNFQANSPHQYKVQFSYNHLVNQTEASYTTQFFLPESFRKSLIRESGLYQYQVKNPLELAPELRTERWQKLCDYLNNYPTLTKATQIKVIRLLSNLCFHQAVLEYVSPISEVEMASNLDNASLALLRDSSDLMFKVDHRLSYDCQELERIAKNATAGSVVKFSALMDLLVESAKTFKDVKAAEFWRSTVEQEIETFFPSLDAFTTGLLMSIYYRGAVFVPLLKKDKEKVIAEMDLCQAYAESLLPENEEQKIVAYENLNIIGESRTKEAIWLGDLDLAEERARKLIERDILASRYRLELGEVLLKQGRVEEAGHAYLSATRLGPPGTPEAWFMAGQCYQSLGELELAYDCYLACLQSDPSSISAVKRLSQIAPVLGNEKLASWCELRSSQLEEEKQKMVASGSSFVAYNYKLSIPTPVGTA